MDLFQRELEKILSRVGDPFIVSRIKDKLKRQGIRLTSAEIREVERHIARGDFPEKSLRLASRPSQTASIIFDQTDLNDFEDYLKRVSTEVPHMLQEIADKNAPQLLRTFKKNWPQYEQAEFSMMDGFSKRLLTVWKLPLSRLAMLITMATETGDAANRRFRMSDQLENQLNLVNVLTRLHARSCQVAREVHVLLKSGFADAAMARWRTLHEIGVTMTFILEKGEDTALRYALHNRVESYRAACIYQENCRRIRHKPLSQSELVALRSQYDALISRFGKPYGTPYGWAAADLGKAHPSFSDVEAAVRLDHMRSYYKLASHNVHSNPKAIFFSLGQPKRTEVLLTGPSNTGLADPGQNTGLSLTLATSSLIAIQPTFDDALALQVMSLLARELSDLFVNAQLKLEKRDRENRKRKRHLANTTKTSVTR